MLLNSPPIRTYDLRARTRAGLAVWTGQATHDSPSPSDLDNCSDEEAPHAADFVPEAAATVTVRRYSNVVAARPPSPLRERHVPPSAGPLAGPGHAGMPEPSNDGNYESRSNNDHGMDSMGSVGEEETPDNPEYSSWTEVQHRRARSDGTLPNRKNLMAEQNQTVKMAAKNLTKEEQEKYKRRQEKVQLRQGSTASSRGEGTSRQKGKNVDTREWGNVDFSHEKFDIDAQIAALKALRHRQNPNNARRERSPQKRLIIKQKTIQVIVLRNLVVRNIRDSLQSHGLSLR